MDPLTTIIGLFFLALFIVPFILMSRKGKKGEKQILQSLTSMADQNKSQLTTHEIFGNIALGMDEMKNLVFFCKKNSGQPAGQTIDLAGIQQCRLLKISRTINSKEGKQEVTDRLELCFIPRAKDKPELRLEIFNADAGGELNGELQSLEKWSARINSLLKSKFNTGKA
jgi:hypothetical protein